MMMVIFLHERTYLRLYPVVLYGIFVIIQKTVNILHLLVLQEILVQLLVLILQILMKMHRLIFLLLQMIRSQIIKQCHDFLYLVLQTRLLHGSEQGCFVLLPIQTSVVQLLGIILRLIQRLISRMDDL